VKPSNSLAGSHECVDIGRRSDSVFTQQPNLVSERIYSGIWAAGLRLRKLAKRARLLGPIEPFLLRLGPRLVPSPTKETSVPLLSGMILRIPPGYPAARSYSSGRYEPDVTRLFETIIEEGMTVVDAGANVGYYSLISSSLVGATGRVYAFEPDPLNFQYLKLNIEVNRCLNLRALQLALSDSETTSRFMQDSVGGAEGYLTSSSDHESTIEVQVSTFDTFFKAIGWPSVDVVKLDVEGSEAHALRGMFELSKRNPRLQLIMELNADALSRAGTNSAFVAGLLRDLGFVEGHIIEAGYVHFDLYRGLPPTRATYNLHLQKARPSHG